MSEELESKIRFWKRSVWISAICTIVPPLFGMGGTVFGMVNAFQRMSENGDGAPDELAGDISLALTTTAVGLVFSTVFAVILIGASIRLVVLMREDRRQRSS